MVKARPYTGQLTPGVHTRTQPIAGFFGWPLLAK